MRIWPPTYEGDLDESWGKYLKAYQRFYEQELAKIGKRAYTVPANKPAPSLAPGLDIETLIKPQDCLDEPSTYAIAAFLQAVPEGELWRYCYLLHLDPEKVESFDLNIKSNPVKGKKHVNHNDSL